MSFEQLENVDPLATNLLKLFGFLDHKDMWYDLCLGTIRDEEPDWVRELASKRRFQEVLTRLHNLSFVEVKLGQNGEEPTYEIHPAIHEFARSRARGEEVEELVRCAVSLVAARVPRSNAQGFIKTIHRLEPHAEQCLIHMKQGRTGCHIDLVELEKFGSLFRHLGRYDEATRLYEGILHMLRAEDQPDEATIELTAGIENNLGLIYHARQKYDVALQLYQNSCERLSEMPVEDEKASQITAYNAGRSFMMLGKLDKALREFNQAEQYFSRVLQESPMSDCRDGQWYIYFRIINDIGEIHLRQKNVDLAEQCFRTSFDGFKRCFYELHPVTFTVRLNMGRVCMEQSRYVTAKKIFDFIVDTYTGWWGRRHSETMRAVAELADSYMRHGEAKQLMGDGGERELSVATELYSEVFKYHQEVRGTNSGTAFLMSQKLERLQSLSYSTSGDKYGEYYSMNS
jgi:tetratricopeptide (TPR) repeat protein